MIVNTFLTTQFFFSFYLKQAQKTIPRKKYFFFHGFMQLYTKIIVYL